MEIVEFFNKEMFKAVGEFTEEVMGLAQQNYVDQGHNLSGRGRDSFSYEVKLVPSGYRSEVYVIDYVLIVNNGIPARRIPFGGRKTGAKTSKMIEGLIGYFKKRGRSATEAKRAAFATANVWKREGMSTRDSRKFSKTGRRQSFLNEAVKQSEGLMEAFFERAGGDAYLLTVTQLFNNIQKEFRA